MIKTLALCIIDTKIDVITANPKLQLASNDINPDAFHFLFAGIYKIQKICALFLVSILKTFATVRDCRALWCKTIADQRTNIEDQDSENSKDLVDESDTDPIETRELLLLQNNIPRIANKSLIEQSVARKNKKLVSIIFLCFLSYSRSEQTNLFQMLNKHFLFANYVSKQAVETFHQMGFVVSSKTVCRTLQVNAQAISSRLKERMQSQQFFISYDNVNFYKKIRDQHLYNKTHIVNYTAGFVCFMNAEDRSVLPYINHN